jgi:hypothetical protein
MSTPPRAASPARLTCTNESSPPVKTDSVEAQLPAGAADMDRLARKTASTITDPELDALYDQRDALLRLVAVSRVAGAVA